MLISFDAEPWQFNGGVGSQTGEIADAIFVVTWLASDIGLRTDLWFSIMSLFINKSPEFEELNDMSRERFLLFLLQVSTSMFINKY